MDSSSNSKTNKERRTVSVLNQGYKWNPAVGLPRNEPCLCGSGKKFKRCCLGKIPRAIPTDEKMKEILHAQAIEKLRKETLGK